MMFTSLHSCANKLSFNSEKSAKHYIKHVSHKRPHANMTYVRPYYCTRCGKWHTTTKVEG